MNQNLLPADPLDQLKEKCKFLKKRIRLCFVIVLILLSGCIACAVAAAVHPALLRSWGNTKQTGSQS